MSQIQPPDFFAHMITRLRLGRNTPRDPRLFHANGGFLSDVELTFYHALREAAAPWAVVCPKVALADLLTADAPQERAQIDGQSADFVLFDPKTMQPLLAVELDDGSAPAAPAGELLADAGLPLQRVPVEHSYPLHELAAVLRQAAGADKAPEKVVPATNGRAARTAPAEVPTCPLCGHLMMLRTVSRPGPYEGKQFWACAHYPRCHGVREYRGAK
jgi:hypothetical protein